MDQPASVPWLTLIVSGQIPRWVPQAVAEAFLDAHQNDRRANILPENLLVDTAHRRIIPSSRVQLADGGAVDDLASCLGQLLSLTWEHPQFARRVFQQVALIWRCYREGQGLPTRSAFEAEVVSRAVSALTIENAPWMQTITRSHAGGSIPTLHDLIDKMFDRLRDTRALS